MVVQLIAPDVKSCIVWNGPITIRGCLQSPGSNLGDGEGRREGLHYVSNIRGLENTLFGTHQTELNLGVITDKLVIKIFCRYPSYDYSISCPNPGILFKRLNQNAPPLG